MAAKEYKKLCICQICSVVLDLLPKDTEVKTQIHDVRVAPCSQPLIKGIIVDVL